MNRVSNGYPNSTTTTNIKSNNNNGAPDGIWTRVEASRGLHDWPLHYRSLSLLNDKSFIIISDNQKISKARYNYNAEKGTYIPRTQQRP